jgi:hypothetical protein
MERLVALKHAFTIIVLLLVHATNGGSTKANPNQTEVLMGQHMCKQCAIKPLACAGRKT